MNRIEKKFKELRRQKKKAFVAFVTAGYPSLPFTRRLVVAMAENGADIIELGVPFSDPMADGPVIQEASHRALQKGVTLGKVFQTVKAVRRRSQIPIALMTYYNPVFRYGEKRFAANAKKAGVDGLVIPDLPPEEARGLIAAARSYGLALVFFVSPTTPRARMRNIALKSTGFIYYVSVTGVTGARRRLPGGLHSNVRFLTRVTRKPVCVGFGVSDPAQVRAVGRVSDGVIVGSAIIKKIRQVKGDPDAVGKTARFVGQLAGALP